MHPKPFTLADHLRAGHSALTAWMQLGDPALADVFAREAFDCVIFDMQHGMSDVASTLRGISAVNHAGKPAAVRLQLDDWSNAARYLDNGAECVIAPMINTAEDAKRFASAVKYPPMGERSWGAGRTIMLTGQGGLDYILSANAGTLALAMIETKQALDNIDAILAVPGIDGVFLGPSDMSIALSNGKELDPFSASVATAATHILHAAKRAGKIAGSYGTTQDAANALVKKGFQLVCVANDVQLIREGLRDSLARARQKI